MQLRSLAFLAVFCTSLSAAAAPPGPGPGPSPSVKRPPTAAEFGVPPACKTTTPDSAQTGNPWAFYITSDNINYASTECGYYVGEVSFTSPNPADKKVVFGGYLHNLNDPQSQKNKESCETTETTIHVLVDGERVAGASAHGVWEERARKCELDGASAGTSLVPMKKTFRVLVKRSINGQAKPVSAQAKQV